MTKADTMRMAREAGLLLLLDEDCFQSIGAKNFDATKRVLQSFAELVAAYEREACAKVADGMTYHSFLGAIGKAIRERSANARARSNT